MMSLSSLCWTRKEQRMSILTIIGSKIKPKVQVLVSYHVFYNRLAWDYCESIYHVSYIRGRSNYT